MDADAVLVHSRSITRIAGIVVRILSALQLLEKFPHCGSLANDDRSTSPGAQNRRTRGEIKSEVRRFAQLGTEEHISPTLALYFAN